MNETFSSSWSMLSIQTGSDSPGFHAKVFPMDGISYRRCLSSQSRLLSSQMSPSFLNFGTESGMGRASRHVLWLIRGHRHAIGNSKDSQEPIRQMSPWRKKKKKKSMCQVPSEVAQPHRESSSPAYDNNLTHIWQAQQHTHTHNHLFSWGENGLSNSTTYWDFPQKEKKRNTHTPHITTQIKIKETEEM